jgi:hypothetical protein
MAKNSINWNILLIVGGVVGALYLWNKSKEGSAEKVETRQEGMTDRTQLRQENKTERTLIRNETIKEFIDLFDKKDSIKDVSPNVVTTTSNKNYVTKVTPKGSIFTGTPIVQVTTSTGQTSDIVQKPNTFYSNIGIGFDSKGQGYSSINPLFR